MEPLDGVTGLTFGVLQLGFLVSVEPLVGIRAPHTGCVTHIWACWCQPWWGSVTTVSILWPANLFNCKIIPNVCHTVPHVVPKNPPVGHGRPNIGPQNSQRYSRLWVTDRSHWGSLVKKVYGPQNPYSTVTHMLATHTYGLQTVGMSSYALSLRPACTFWEFEVWFWTWIFRSVSRLTTDCANIAHTATVWLAA